MPVSWRRAARFSQTARSWPESVVTAKRRRRRQSRLSSPISRATRLRFTAQLPLAQLLGHPPVAVVAPMLQRDPLHRGPQFGLLGGGGALAPVTIEAGPAHLRQTAHGLDAEVGRGLHHSDLR